RGGRAGACCSAPGRSADCWASTCCSRDCVWTTGGRRGGSERRGAGHPRSFTNARDNSSTFLFRQICRLSIMDFLGLSCGDGLAGAPPPRTSGSGKEVMGRSKVVGGLLREASFITARFLVICVLPLVAWSADLSGSCADTFG